MAEDRRDDDDSRGQGGQTSRLQSVRADETDKHGDLHLLDRPISQFVISVHMISLGVSIGSSTFPTPISRQPRPALPLN